MAKVIQFRRGTTAENNVFTGAEGEITVDTTTKTLVVHDGTTPGGNRLLGTKELEERVASGEFKGEKGDKGAPGADGATGPAGTSVSSVTQTTTSTADGGTNVITVTLSNGTTSTFSVKNGSKGSTGSSGALQTTGVYAGWYGQSSNQTQTTSKTIKVPYFYVDAYGRITTASSQSVYIHYTCNQCNHSCDCCDS